MLKILVFAVIVTLIVIVSAKYKKMDPVQKRKTLWRVGIGTFLGILLLLAIKGKLPWIAAAVGALIPFLRTAYGLLNQVWPLWLQRKKVQQETQYQEPPTAVSVSMAIQEALDVLGLSGDLTKGEITEAMVLDAHRKLIQKLHPDRGGNDYLAAKINQARDQLLEKING